MNKSLISALELLGASTKEIQLYEYLLTSGPIATNQLAKLTDTKRSTAYLLVDSLLSKKLISKEVTNYKITLYPTSPEKLYSALKQRRTQYKKASQDLKNSLPELEANYSYSTLRPKAKVYEGPSGLFRIWQDILSTNKKEVLIWTNQETERRVFSQRKHDNFIEERVNKKIPAKVLAVTNPGGLALRQGDPLFLRQTKLLPPETYFSAETYIYDNKVAILDYNQAIIGIIIENQSVSDSYKAMFTTLFNLL